MRRICPTMISMKQFVKQIATAINYLHTKWKVTHNGVWYSGVYLVPTKGTVISDINDWLIDSFFDSNSEFRIIFKLANFEECCLGDDILHVDKMHLLQMARELVLN